MELAVWARVGLLFVHLLLCAAALHLVLSTDLRVLRRRVSAGTMHRVHRVHRRLALLLAGLWLSGAAVVLHDYGADLSQVLQHPKLLTKLACVSLLTLNALVLRFYALPRISRLQPLAALETHVLAVTGAVSTASWLMAAFLGLARPLADWPVGQALGLYGAVLGAAVGVALLVCPRLLAQRSLEPGQTVFEEVAATPPQQHPMA